MTEPEADPQAGVERRIVARHLLSRPLTCKEHDPDLFRLIRRHETQVDRWFTQRLGYRLHVDGDTARLFKSGYIPADRALRTSSGRAFTRQEYVILALVLSTTVAGPDIISLRDLVEGVRSTAVEAGLDLDGDATERRAIVMVLRWMIGQGLAEELHETVDRYVADAEADAILSIRPDRVTLLPLPALVEADHAGEVVERSSRRSATRQWLRGRLTEDPVLYQEDVSDEEWAELRRRLGEEERIADEMFGLVLESRAEGVAAIDPDGDLTEERFPLGGTLGHATLLLIDEVTRLGGSVGWDDLEAIASELVDRNAKLWSKELVEAPHLLAARTVDLLVALRLARRQGDHVVLLPAAARFLAVLEPETQASLW